MKYMVNLSLTRHRGGSKQAQDGWMFCDFMSFSAVFQSYEEAEMKQDEHLESVMDIFLRK